MLVVGVRLQRRYEDYEMTLLKRFLTQSKNIEKSGVFWNMVASMLVAFQSVILLMVMNRTVGFVSA